MKKFWLKSSDSSAVNPVKSGSDPERLLLLMRNSFSFASFVKASRAITPESWQLLATSAVSPAKVANSVGMVPVSGLDVNLLLERVSTT